MTVGVVVGPAQGDGFKKKKNLFSAKVGFVAARVCWTFIKVTVGMSVVIDTSVGIAFVSEWFLLCLTRHPLLRELHCGNHLGPLL